MSHWDFGRPADVEPEAPRSSGAAGAVYPPDLPGHAGDRAWPAPDGGQDRWEAPDAWPAAAGWPAGDGWPAPVGWPADGGYATQDAWHDAPSPDAIRAPADGGYPDETWPATGDGWDDDEAMETYPLTYERDDFVGAAPPPTPARAPWEHAPWEQWPPPPDPAGPGDADTKVLSRDVRQPAPPAQAPTAPPLAAAGHATEDTAGAGRWTGRDLGLAGDDQEDWIAGGRGGRFGSGRRWLIPAGVVVAGAAVGAAAVLLTGGHPAAGGDHGTNGLTAPSGTPGAPTTVPPRTVPSGAASPGTASPTTGQSGAGALTLSQAKVVLANYTTVNNTANAQRSAATLASVESGSSYAIDTSLYQEQQAAGTAPYPAFGPVGATYYIPRDEPAGGPRWFVVQVANAFTANQKKVTSNEYLLFTQAAGGGPWQDTVEPYLLPGTTAPRVDVGADGLATAVSPDAGTVAVAPSQVPAATAASLDGTGTGTIANPGNLADRADQKFWQGKVPGGTVTDAHTAASGADGQEFALRTTDGGALVFYTDAAQLTITPPAGSTLHLTIPGLYSPAQALNQAGVSYLEQFAAYDPPSGGGAPRVVAGYSGITGRN
jgi:hypothetical protein